MSSAAQQFCVLGNEGVQVGEYDNALLRRRLIPRTDKDCRGCLVAIHDEVRDLRRNEDVVTGARNLFVFEALCLTSPANCVVRNRPQWGDSP